MLTQPKRIVILTTGRFHVCDLARELDALGHDVVFISCVPKSRTRPFGLPDRCNRCILPWVAPFFLFARLARSPRARALAEHWLTEAVGLVGMFVVPRCDLFIGVSGMSRRAAMKARRKFGARVWIERGSRHILSQAEILSRIAQDDPGATRVSQAAIRREIADYAVADRIVVPSRHVEESFLAEGTPPATLFRNPYGVDLRAFGPTQAPAPDSPVILMVGAWSLRKGADVLVEAWRSLQGVRLIHVGPVVDLPLPAIEGFEHVPPVPQSRLREFYGMASVFALASREEGLALVQAQALACGLRLVCTTRTGGEDLRDLLGVPDVVFVSAADAAQEFAANLRRALDAARADNGLREPLGAARERLSWKAYGERYGLEIDRDLGGVAKGLKPASVSSIPESFRTPA